MKSILIFLFLISSSVNAADYFEVTKKNGAPRVVVSIQMDALGNSINTFQNLTNNSAVVTNPPYDIRYGFKLNAVSYTSGIINVGYNYLSASVQSILFIDCTRCDGGIFYLVTNSATPPADTESEGSMHFLSPLASREIEFIGGQHLHYKWASPNRVTGRASVRYNKNFLSGY